MNERGSELYHIIGELIAIGNMLQSEKINCSCNRLYIAQLLQSTFVVLQLLQSTFVDHISDAGNAPLAVMLEWPEVETGISGKGASLG